MLGKKFTLFSDSSIERTIILNNMWHNIIGLKLMNDYV
jgi:hypothetical protein